MKQMETESKHQEGIKKEISKNPDSKRTFPDNERSVFQIGTSAYYIFNLSKYTFAYMDEAIEDITGIPANEFQDKTPLETLGEITEVSHLEGINEFVNKSIEKHLSPDEKNPITINLVYNIVTRRQEKKRLHVRYIFSEFEGNTPTFTKGVATDITHIQKDGMPVFFIVKNNRVIYREVGQPEILLRKSSIPLSRTELNILRLTSKGFSAKEISVLMKISLSTLYTHRKNIKAKMGKDINFVISMLRGKGFIS